MTDTDFYAANLEALTSAVPGWSPPGDAAAPLIAGEGPAEAEPYLSGSRPGTPRLIDGVWRLDVAGKSLAFHSREPQREAERIAADLAGSDRPPSLIVAIGLGAGYLLDALDQRGWSGTVLAVEPDARLLVALLSRPALATWVHEQRLKILVGDDFSGAADCWPLFGDGSVVPSVYVSPVLSRLYPAGVERARALVDRLKGEAANNAAAKRALGGRYLLNTLANLAAIGSEGDVATLFGGAQARPAIVVAAGPSLDRLLPALSEAQKSAVVICVDTALRPLLAAGITPNFVVTVDPSQANARHLTDLPPCDETCLVAEASLDPLALGSFRGRTFFFTVSNHHPWPWLQTQGYTVGRLRVWGSVLTTAFDLAMKMGCNPIVFAGADLAYTDDRPYARNVVFEEDWRRRAEWGQPLEAQWAEATSLHPRVLEPDVAGKETNSAPHLIAFRNWLLEQMRKERDRTFYNITGGGILHGAGITQASAVDLPTLFGEAPGMPPALGGRHHRPGNSGVLAAACALLEAARAGDTAAEQILAGWRELAVDLSRDEIVAALGRAVTLRPAAPVHGGAAPAVHPDVVPVASWLAALAENIVLVPMRLDAHRLTEWSAVRARIFFFRSSAARLIMSTLQAPDGALLEDGRPLREAPTIHDVVPGTYRTCRDELHFRASDDTDPRTNGRVYALMVPPCISALESLPLREILDRRL
jgi:hypothetical protein